MSVVRPSSPPPHKAPSGGGRKVYMQRAPSPEKPRKVTAQVGGVQVTVTKERPPERKLSPNRPFDLREKLKGVKEEKLRTAEGGPSKVADRKISVMEEDIFEPDYDEGIEFDVDSVPKAAAAKVVPPAAPLDGSESSDSDSSAAGKKKKAKKHKKDKDKKEKKKAKKEKKKHKKHKTKSKNKD